MSHISEFEQHLREQDRSPHTIKAYMNDIRLFERWLEEYREIELVPSRILSVDIADYRKYLRSIPQKAATINRKLAALSVFFAWARKEKLTEKDPTEDTKSITVIRVVPKWLKRIEVNALRRATQEIYETKKGKAKTQACRDRAIISLLLNTGIRAGETASIRLSDIEIKERSGSLTITGKGLKQRTLPLNSRVRKALSDYLERCPKDKNEFLFMGQRGKPLSPTAISHIVSKYAKKAGLENVTAHNLRHTFARSMLNNGVSIGDVSRLLGHTTVETTLIYMLPDEDTLQEAVEKLESS